MDSIDCLLSVPPLLLTQNVGRLPGPGGEGLAVFRPSLSTSLRPWLRQTQQSGGTTRPYLSTIPGLRVAVSAPVPNLLRVWSSVFAPTRGPSVFM